VEALKSWGMLNVPMGSGAASRGGAITLFEVIERHGGAIWSHADNPSGLPALRLMVPVAEEGALEAGRGNGAAGDHDFDFTLFHSKASSGELETLPLDQLGYTVFDTETTGLNPTGGDEIIAIGAVRVFNGRVLRREIFDCLVDPRRAISEESAAIHGITAAMLRGMPTIDEVLPRFQRFVEDTVMIGHNVAFDMRFLELKQDATGIRFDNPVLDTLLLASAVQPKRVDQRLDALAERLGVPIAGRHTALGDALTTAEVFLALIPMLKARGITTLSEAKQACDATKYAKIKY
jgi:DNA polymerase-3 subunit epsilon